MASASCASGDGRCPAAATKLQRVVAKRQAAGRTGSSYSPLGNMPPSQLRERSQSEYCSVPRGPVGYADDDTLILQDSLPPPPLWPALRAPAIMVEYGRCGGPSGV